MKHVFEGTGSLEKEDLDVIDHVTVALKTLEPRNPETKEFLNGRHQKDFV